MNHQQVFLGSCMLDPSLINYGVLHGLKPSAFTSLESKAIWMQLLDNRTNNRLTDMQSLYLDMGTNVPAADLMACEQLAPTSAYGKKALTVILEAAVVKNIRPALNDALSLIDDGEPYSRVKTAVEGLNDLLRIEEVIEADLPKTIEEAMTWVNGQITGNTTDEKVVMTGLRKFDEYAGAIGMHEYVVLGARTL